MATIAHRGRPVPVDFRSTHGRFALSISVELATAAGAHSRAANINNNNNNASSRCQSVEQWSTWYAAATTTEKQCQQCSIPYPLGFNYNVWKMSPNTSTGGCCTVATWLLVLLLDTELQRVLMYTNWFEEIVGRTFQAKRCKWVINSQYPANTKCHHNHFERKELTS